MMDEYVYLHQPEHIQIAPTARIDRWVRINGGEGCVIGEHVHIASGCVINAGNGKVTMGEGSGCSNNVVICAGQPDLSYAHISAADEPTHQHPIRGETTIGSHVVIFANATILPGVHVGDYAVIGAGAVVSKDVPKCAIMMGVPAQMVGRREQQPDGTFRTDYYPKLHDIAQERDIDTVMASIREKYGFEPPRRYAYDFIDFAEELMRASGT